MRDLCRHILTSGNRCTQPALHGRLYCRHHKIIRAAVQQAAPPPDPYRTHTLLPFVFPEDRAALQLNFFLVIQALNDKRLTNQTALAYTRLLRACAMNLNKGSLTDSTSNTEPVCDVVLTPEGDEIAPPRTVAEEGDEQQQASQSATQPVSEEAASDDAASDNAVSDDTVSDNTVSRNQFLNCHPERSAQREAEGSASLFTSHECEESSDKSAAVRLSPAPRALNPVLDLPAGLTRQELEDIYYGRSTPASLSQEHPA